MAAAPRPPDRATGRATARPLVVLKSPAFQPWADLHGGRLRYGIDALEDHGYVLRWTDAHLGAPWTAWPLRHVVRLVERTGTHVVQTCLLARSIRRAPVTLAMFESEGHFLALVRGLLPAAVRRRLRRGRDSRKLVIVACWLSELAPGLSPRKQRLYRRLYGAVDLVTVYSSNQPAVLERVLGIPPERVAVVPFGIDTDELAGRPSTEDGTVVAVGRDNGRDWGTLFDAARGTGWRVRLATRPHQIAGLDVPAEVEVLGFVPREQYLDLLAAASVVVVPTRELAYPTGQSVLLEAMALGKACVVTDTPAMRDYVRDGVTCLTVPLGDAAALRTAVDRLLADETLRRQLGTAARAEVAERFTDRAMWAAVADAIAAIPTRS